MLYSFKLEGDTQGWLEIDAATGEIRSKDKLDRETLETFQVTVIAFEKGEIIDLSQFIGGFSVCKSGVISPQVLGFVLFVEKEKRAFFFKIIK